MKLACGCDPGVSLCPEAEQLWQNVLAAQGWTRARAYEAFTKHFPVDAVAVAMSGRDAA